MTTPSIFRAPSEAAVERWLYRDYFGRLFALRHRSEADAKRTDVNTRLGGHVQHYVSFVNPDTAERVKVPQEYAIPELPPGRLMEIDALAIVKPAEAVHIRALLSDAAPKGGGDA